MAVSLEYAFVCFIDILGFAEMVRHDCEASHGKSQYIQKLLTVHSNTSALNDIGLNFQISQFSDSVIFSAPFQSDKFPEFVDVISKYQYYLFQEHILCRGGIAHGKHFHRGSFVFSSGLTEAYNVERTIARYPRIVVSKELMELLYPFRELPTALHLMIENGEEAFVDFLHSASFRDCEWFVNNAGEASKLGGSVKEKYMWLLNYFKFKFPADIRDSYSYFTYPTHL